MISTVMTAQNDYSKYYKNLPVQMPVAVGPTIPDNNISLKDAGGTGDGVTMNTEAFSKAISELDKRRWAPQRSCRHLSHWTDIAERQHRPALGKKRDYRVFSRQKDLIKLIRRLENQKTRQHQASMPANGKISVSRAKASSTVMANGGDP